MADWDRKDGNGAPASAAGMGSPREARPDPLPNDRDRRDNRQDPAGGYGGAARGYGDGGDSSYGQMASGSSDSGLGGYSGADVGGYGQPNLNSQWGQGGYAPLNQGLDYGQGGARFGPAGYASGNFGQAPRRSAGRNDHVAGPHDPHHESYSHWRDTQLAGHDRDYTRWREEQTRRYDEDYGNWRNERHSAFSHEFEGWRAGRGGQATGSSFSQEKPVSGSERQPTSEGFAHGANPALSHIADGDTGRHHHSSHSNEAKKTADK